MKDWKTICKKLLSPPIPLAAVLAVLCTALLICVFVKGWEESPAAYAVYVLSFYTLTVVCITCSVVLPEYYKKAKEKVYGSRLGNRYMTDPVFKVHIGLYRSLLINLLYAAFNLISGIYYSTAWFMLFAGYYLIMAVMRFLLVRYVNKNGIGKNREGELKRSRLCAVILLTVNLSLSGAVLMMIYFDRGFSYYGFLIYVMAMYTFYITTAAVVGMVKYKKYNSPVMSSAKSVNLAAALISLLSLETAMLSQFGQDTPPETRRVLIIATGAGISLIILSISVYTVVRSTVELKKIKRSERTGLEGVKNG